MIIQLLQTIECKADTLVVIDADKVATFYADMMEKQANQFNIFLVAIGVVFAIVLGSTWWWNYSGSRAKISQDIDDGLKKYQRLFNAHKVSTEQQINEEVETKVKEQMEQLAKTMRGELDVVKNEITGDNNKMHANISRVFALHCYTGKYFFHSASWWLTAFEDYVTVGDGEFQQISIDAYVDALEKCLSDDPVSANDQEALDKLIERTAKIPDVFTRQRKKAKKLLTDIKENPEK